MPQDTFSALSVEDFENIIKLLFDKISSDGANGHVRDDTIFDKISDLVSVGKEAWANRPRTYTVLRLINCANVTDDLAANEFLDIQLPYNSRSLPDILRGTSRHRFLEKQTLVLSDASDLELENGQHRHFAAGGERFFTLGSYLGHGGSGRVDRVHSKLSLEEYALKRISRKLTMSRDKASARIIENELTILKRLRHRHLVTFIGSYTDPHYIGMLTTPVAECNLKTFLRNLPLGPPEQSLLRRFFGCLCAAVEYLHSKKCRHKDIKPGNILVRKGDVFITDFGLALDWSDRSRGSTSGAPGPHTQMYAAPEVVNCERRNESSDIWSLGCVYLDMLTVLKGKSVDDMRSFFKSHGSGFESMWSNMDALEEWLRYLENHGGDNIPLPWIRSMLQHAPRQRPSAAGILDNILNSEDENIYCGECCAALEEDCYSSSSKGPVFAAGSLITPSSTASSVLSFHSVPDGDIGRLSKVKDLISSDKLDQTEESSMSAVKPLLFDTQQPRIEAGPGRKGANDGSTGPKLDHKRWPNPSSARSQAPNHPPPEILKQEYRKRVAFDLYSQERQQAAASLSIAESVNQSCEVGNPPRLTESRIEDFRDSLKETQLQHNEHGELKKRALAERQTLNDMRKELRGHRTKSRDMEAIFMTELRQVCLNTKKLDLENLFKLFQYVEDAHDVIGTHEEDYDEEERCYSLLEYRLSKKEGGNDIFGDLFKDIEDVKSLHRT